jgi:hypothetical protein
VNSGLLSGKTPSPIKYDESNWPYVIATLPPRECSEAEFRETLRRLDEYAARGGEFGFVLDTRGAPDPNAARRRAIAEYWDGCQRRYPDLFIGAAIVMSSSTGRAVFKAILWLRQVAQPLVPVATPEEGLERLRSLARKSDKLKAL